MSRRFPFDGCTAERTRLGLGSRARSAGGGGCIQPPPPALLARLPNPSRVRSAVHPSNGNRRLTERPDRMKGAAHSSLGYLTPAEYARQCTHQMETDDSQNVRTE
ncbi:hypothetical protein MICRO116_390028 [Micrococcus sp. 116]|nr:hypothetical protein MICRO116_390028 [Micrococcus sp. 116]